MNQGPNNRRPSSRRRSDLARRQEGNRFNSRKDSLNYFKWRNSQYPGYIELMPVSNQDGKIVLDYGCGPGNDLVGFAEFSNVKELIGVDVSKPALELAEKRILDKQKS